MYIIIALFALLIGFQVWAMRAYLDFMATHPEVEKRLIESAMRQSC
ncbi:MAG: hypothetical protein IPF94_18350 [Betaproteobacteria bacterium]|nr:hypothetical protein [Betaproteobacteria bacterium]